MAVKPTSVPEDTLQSSGDEPIKCVVNASGLHLTSQTAGVLATIDNSGNASFAGTSTPTGSSLLSTANGITAGTTQTQVGATALTADVSRISTCANANDGVRLPTAVVGMRKVVINDGAQTAKVWPASGDNLGAGVDTATTQATTVVNTYYCYAANTWRKV